MILYHSSPNKNKILKPLHPEKYQENELIHDSVVWFGEDRDYTIFMVIFRQLEEEYTGIYRFFNFRKKALFYPDKYGPLLQNHELFTKLFENAENLELKNPVKVYIHQTNTSANSFKKSKWGDFYTQNPVKVDKIIEINDALKYLKENDWKIKINLASKNT